MALRRLVDELMNFLKFLNLFGAVKYMTRHEFKFSETVAEAVRGTSTACCLSM
jgi:hypothetical protein